MVLKIHPQQPEYTGLQSVDIEFMITSSQHSFNHMLCTQPHTDSDSQSLGPSIMLAHNPKNYTFLPVRERFITIHKIVQFRS
jgi:protein tyrosine phosphatase (PTP) superfamily phosphohydrolase (DUF442 family)